MSGNAIGELRLLLAALLLGSAAFGHHSLAAEFDLDRAITIKGTIARVEWINPHAWIYVDVPQDSGEPQPSGGPQRWAFEIGSPSEMIRRGWKRADLRVGDHVSIEALLAKKLPHTGNAQSIVLANGKKVFSGRTGSALPESPAEELPSKR